MTDLLQQINALIHEYGCEAVEITAEAVNVMGDSRSYLPAVVVQFPPDMDWDQIGYISTMITNRVRVSRVLMEIASVATQEQRMHLIGLIRSRVTCP